MLTRTREPEIMDSPAINSREHERALRGLARLNACSGSVWALWQPIRRLAAALDRKQLRILDVATGCADNPISLWELGKRAGLELIIDGCDISDTALAVSREAATRAGAPGKFFKLNVMDEQLPTDYDVIMSSLFTHHLAEDEVVKFLDKMKSSTKHMLVVNDLVRSYPSLMMVSVATQMLSRSPVVHSDGPASVRAAFTPDELKALALDAGLNSVNIVERFPCRMMLVWRRDKS